MGLSIPLLPSLMSASLMSSLLPGASCYIRDSLLTQHLQGPGGSHSWRLSSVIVENGGRRLRQLTEVAAISSARFLFSVQGPSAWRGGHTQGGSLHLLAHEVTPSLKSLEPCLVFLAACGTESWAARILFLYSCGCSQRFVSQDSRCWHVCS